MKPQLSRRSALKTMAGTAAVAAVAASLEQRLVAEDRAAGRRGNVNHSVCKWCYPKVSLEDLCVAGKEIGLKSIELLTLEEIPTVKKHGLTCAMVSGVPGGITRGLNRLENHDAILEWFANAAPRAAALECPQIICFSGNRAGLDDEQGIKNCVAGIKRLLPVAEKHNVTLVMELLNSKVNHADYQCDLSKWGVALCEAVGSPHFKLLYDIYHMQIMEGDMIATIRKHHQWFAHYHTGGVPGRNEIDESQEIYYPAVMRAIVATGFKGFVAQEFIPKREDKIASLHQGVDICDV
ncbi:MAG TPA: hydroxypyruvate isomerase [Verrucomicrobiales bacterium]|nr:hydroxypyruvate isomerase [Verrucomicrobiales bacterium]